MISVWLFFAMKKLFFNEKKMDKVFIEKVLEIMIIKKNVDRS